MTIVRLTEITENIISYGHAKGIQGNIAGILCMVEVDDWVKWERKLVEGPYVHHCVGIHADVIPVLYEAVKYIPGIQLDLVDTTEDAIVHWLNGGSKAWISEA